MLSIYKEHTEKEKFRKFKIHNGGKLTKNDKFWPKNWKKTWYFRMFLKNCMCYWPTFGLKSCALVIRIILKKNIDHFKSIMAAIIQKMINLGQIGPKLTLFDLSLTICFFFFFFYKCHIATSQVRFFNKILQPFCSLKSEMSVFVQN